ncbi:uncharacterized protein BJ212DRAFT_1347378 [Suillus subaureus]|uniref:Uncharacterized protein n=1 Tax=Suillus subaureus TaxID=48587 RepID=A0A9P7JF43_9AGAM|nr:uncharacterized protein BJ212DRAFT_1347378 [Suillus subaureus]KAG1818748.1 hypothetical protein BJ212DRAFT_1347378 [Suillus subaureus]
MRFVSLMPIDRRQALLCSKRKVITQVTSSLVAYQLDLAPSGWPSKHVLGEYWSDWW